MSVFVILGVLVCMEAAGSTDVKTLFVQTGKDVLLEIMDPDAVKDYILLAWRVKKKDNDPEYLVSFSPVDGPDVPENYSKTVFPQANFSVILKNVQKADRGLYDAQLTTRSGQRILVTYNITVLDPVSPVKLTVEPVSSSPDSCNVTVSCTTDDYTISSTLTCTHQTCTNQGHNSEITPSAASLHIYLSDDSITCNHSNQVNWTTALAPINLFCFNNPGPQCVCADVTILRVKIAVFSVGLVVMVSAVISVHFMKTPKKREQPPTSQGK
ncbi:uncharacterized protein LOC115436623 isoform X2 [Sphaeramia orbicularis]|uniref:uncharacterized protein LOC115436623 isoform X2 n=1 Tax=Sphaeramia orbicularis TaxID=375764 RepID=UPI00117F5382|nr:uncharacterized protein LOC115436623 isoform X2 [Sphaeramia orbicularis]